MYDKLGYFWTAESTKLFKLKLNDNKVILNHIIGVADTQLYGYTNKCNFIHFYTFFEFKIPTKREEYSANYFIWLTHYG